MNVVMSPQDRHRSQSEERSNDMVDFGIHLASGGSVSFAQ
jgi:hypothetical protein